MSNTVATRLSRSDAFRSLQLNRRQSLWQALPDSDPNPLLHSPTMERLDDDEPLPALPKLSAVEEVVSDYRTVGLSLREHPISFLRPLLHDLRAVPTRKLATWPNGKRVSVAGLVLLRQRPATAKGVTFVTLEDETGQANLIVRPDVWEKYRRVARTAGAMMATGPLQREGQVIHVLVTQLHDLSVELSDLQTHSRDFR